MIKILRRPFGSILSLVLVLCFAGISTAQISTISDSASQTGFGGPHSIVGTVFGSSGRPVENRVQIRISSMTAGNRTMVTNETGNFAFRGLPNGSYTITIDKEKDYEPISQSVDVQVVGSDPRGQTYTLNIRLVPKASTLARPSVVNAEFAKVPAAARANYDEAVELGKKGEHQAAVDKLKLAIQEYPAFTLAYNEMGVQYLRLNLLESADEAFQRALKTDPNSFPAVINRGIANVLMKRHGEAIPILRKAVKMNDKSAVAHYFLGQALANLGLFDDAEVSLVQSLKLGKEEMKEARRILAIIYAERGAKVQAAEELEAYLKSSPDAPDADKLRELIRQYKGSE